MVKIKSFLRLAARRGDKNATYNLEHDTTEITHRGQHQHDIPSDTCLHSSINHIYCPDVTKSAVSSLKSTSSQNDEIKRHVTPCSIFGKDYRSEVFPNSPIKKSVHNDSAVENSKLWIVSDGVLRLDEKREQTFKNISAVNESNNDFSASDTSQKLILPPDTVLHQDACNLDIIKARGNAINDYQMKSCGVTSNSKEGQQQLDDMEKLNGIYKTCSSHRPDSREYSVLDLPSGKHHLQTNSYDKTSQAYTFQSLDAKCVTEILQHKTDSDQSSKCNTRKSLSNPRAVSRRHKKHPDVDNGWGYVIAIVVFLVAFIQDGPKNSFGILMPNLKTDLHSSVAVISFSAGMLDGTWMAISPLSAKLVKRFGCRPVAFFGAVLASVSLALSTLSTGIEMFVVFYGIMTGAGIGLFSLPAITIVNQYFDKKRGLVLGFVTSGSGVGLLVMAQVIDRLIDSYGWRGAYLLVAGLVLQVCVLAVLMRPLAPWVYAKGEEEEEEEEEEGEEEHVEEKMKKECKIEETDKLCKVYRLENARIAEGETTGVAVEPHTTTRYIDDSTSRNDIIYNRNNTTTNINNIKNNKHTNNANNKNNDDIKVSNIVEFSDTNVNNINHISNTTTNDQSYSDKYPTQILSAKTVKPWMSQPNRPNQDPQAESTLPLLKDSCFVIFCFTAFIFQLTNNIAPMFYPSYAKSMGIPSEKAATIVSIYGISNTVGRFTTGLLSQARINNLLIYSVGTSLTGVLYFLIPLYTSYGTLLASAAGQGFFIGVFPPLQSVILVELLGLERLPYTFGLMCFCKSVGAIAGPTLSGSLYQVASSYTLPFSFAGSMLIFANGLHAVLALLKRRASTSTKPHSIQ